MKLPPKKFQPPNAERPKQQTPVELIADLMMFAKSFYQDDPQQWFKDQHFIKRNVVTWPARWLNNKGVTLPPDRYKSIMIDIFMDIKRHGQTGTIKYWPAYLMKCVQDHFKVHGEEYYNEGKSIRSKIEASMLLINRAAAAPTADPIAALAEVNRALNAAKHKRKKPGTAERQQLALF